MDFNLFFLLVLVSPGCSSKTDYGSFGLEANVRIICNKENGSDEDTGEVNFVLSLFTFNFQFYYFFLKTFIDSLGKKGFFSVFLK